MSRARHSLRVALIAAATLCLSCPGQQDALDAAGPQSGRIESLFWLFFWITLIAFGVVLIVLAGSLLKRSQRATLEPQVTPLPQSFGANIRPTQPIDEKRDRRMVHIITGASAVTLVLLFVMLIASVSTGHAMASMSEENALDVTIIGRQWWWEIHYPDPNFPNKEVITANELHIPAGRTIRLTLLSRDVIHSF